MRARLRSTWKPGQHFSIFSPTRGGKTYLVTRGLLPIWLEPEILARRLHLKPPQPRRRIVILDVKGDDTALRTGRAHDRLPAKLTQPVTRVVAKDLRLGPLVMSEALDRIFEMKDPPLVYADETRVLSQYFGLGPRLDALWIFFGSRGGTMLTGTQAPRWVPSSMYDQAQHHIFFRNTDKKQRTRLSEISSSIDTDQLASVIRSLDWERHQFAYVGPDGYVCTSRFVAPRTPK